MLYHNSIRKYTLALLSTFNNLKIENKLSDGTIQTQNIPINFANKEKSSIFSELDTKQIQQGNTSFLPRASLSISSIVKQEARTTNKYVKINTSNGDFTFNAVPYEFAFELEIQCRGMNEASMIIEQIATKFNPVYSLRINEVPNQTEPTTIQVQLLDIDMIADEFEDISINLVTISAGLSLKGNFYSPVQSMEQIENVDMYINAWHQSEENEYNRAVLYNYDVQDNLTNEGTKYNLVSIDGQFAEIAPVITDVVSQDGADIATINEPYTLEVIYNDYDNKEEEMIFVWSVSGSATIGTGNRIVELTGTASEIVEVSVVITDIHGNNSGTFIKQITVV